MHEQLWLRTFLFFGKSGAVNAEIAIKPLNQVTSGNHVPRKTHSNFNLLNKFPMTLSTFTTVPQ